MQRIWKLHLSVKLGTLFKYEFVFLSGGGEREGELGAAEHSNHANIAKLFYTPWDAGQYFLQTIIMFFLKGGPI